MAQYKVPQDVEADDKLIGPFSFRQVVYLFIAAGLIAAAVGLFQLFPLLAIIPVPFILLLLALALPLKKDQPMETYLVALISYYLKPRKRLWTPGQKESTIFITAPKIVEEVRTRDLSQEEATHRLSFLADIVDTGGYAIKGAGSSSMREDLLAEANATTDMFDEYQSSNLDAAMNRDKTERREELLRGMREAIARNEESRLAGASIRRDRSSMEDTVDDGLSGRVSSVGVNDTAVDYSDVVVRPEALQDSQEKNVTTPPKPSIIELANNSDFSVATIAKEANRINGKEKGEVFISLH